MLLSLYKGLLIWQLANIFVGQQQVFYVFTGSYSICISNFNSNDFGQITYNYCFPRVVAANIHIYSHMGTATCYRCNLYFFVFFIFCLFLAALDMTLKCCISEHRADQSKTGCSLKGLAIATCCHHLCQWKHYISNYFGPLSSELNGASIYTICTSFGFIGFQYDWDLVGLQIRSTCQIWV